MFSLRQYWPRWSFTCHHKRLTALECPLWQTCQQTVLNSHTFFTLWFIWRAGSRKLVVDNMPSLPRLPETRSNDVHCQAGCSLGFLLWHGQPRIDFNEVQGREQPWGHKAGQKKAPAAPLGGSSTREDRPATLSGRPSHLILLGKNLS